MLGLRQHFLGINQYFGECVLLKDTQYATLGSNPGPLDLKCNVLPPCSPFVIKGARWRSGRASDSESWGPGFEPHKRHRVVSLSKAHLLPTVLVKPRKRWLRPDMTEKLLTGTLSLNTNKQTFVINDLYS